MSSHVGEVSEAHHHAELRGAFGNDTFGRMAEKAARFFGTPQYILGQTVAVLAWVILNSTQVHLGFAWDVYPFIALNLLFSLQAAYAAPLILLAQNRQDDRDRANIERDREVAARTQADTEFLARELAAVRLALSDVVTTKDLEDSMEQLAKLIAEQLRDSPAALPSPDGPRPAQDGRGRPGTSA